jgi:hypothetical protein
VRRPPDSSRGRLRLPVASFQSRPAERAECSYALQKLQEENRELREAYEQELRANEAMRMQLIALSQDLERYERKVQVGPRAVPFDGSRIGPARSRDRTAWHRSLFSIYGPEVRCRHHLRILRSQQSSGHAARCARTFYATHTPYSGRFRGKSKGCGVVEYAMYGPSRLRDGSGRDGLRA